MDNFFSYLSSIRWQDAVDITLNSYIIFRLYILFRGTRALQMLIGIAFLWFFQRIAIYMGLIVTSWAIQGITAVTALIIIVVFSNEIRSVFRAKNLKAILWGFPKKAVHTPVEIISESVFEMAKKHCGALIVFPGKEDLEQHMVQKGISWQGVITREMLITIFWHNNPVHDGAVVIQGDRVTQVGVILPLTNRQDIPSFYGTRHRAAMGLAEVSDSLIIVVSEERGVVIAVNGNDVHVMHQQEELEQRLRKHTGNPITRRAGFLRRERLEPILAGFFSVLFIVSIWLGVARGLNTLITIEAPIEYMNRDPVIEILSTSVNTVQLHLSGSDMLIKSIKPEQIRVKVDMEKATVGYNVFPITKESISLPPGILLTKVDPKMVEMEIDIPVTKSFSVQANWTGKLPDGLILESATLSPEVIQLTGSRDILDKISTIYTEKIAIEQLRKSGKLTVRPFVKSPNLRALPEINKQDITIEYVIKERAVEPSS